MLIQKTNIGDLQLRREDTKIIGLAGKKAEVRKNKTYFDKPSEWL